MIHYSPEFQKNLWLEISLTRLVVMPLVLGAIFFIGYLNSDGLHEFYRSLQMTSNILMVILLFVWGTKLAAESVINEVNENTWDFQRMTSTGPWAMALGKLFGSTIYPWYGGAICIVIYVWASLHLPESARHLQFIFIQVTGAVLFHSLSLSLSLIGIQKHKEREKINSSVYVIGAVLPLMILMPGAISQLEYTDPVISWFRFQTLGENFLLCSVLFFLFWSVTGLYRNMRTELQLVNGPWVWIVFILCLMIYIAGFVYNIEDLDPVSRMLSMLFSSYFIAAALAYFMILGESKDIVSFRKLIDKASGGEWQAFGQQLPLWLLSLAMALVICIAIFFRSWGINDPWMAREIDAPAIYFFNLTCFLLRDISLILFLNLKEGARRADLAAVIYLLILYLLIPMMLAVAEMKTLLPVFLPMFERNILNGTLPVMVQVLVMAVLLYQRWKIRNRKFREEL